jgi:hypothetical protein
VILEKIRKSVPNEEIDYLLLTSLLKQYKRPRDKTFKTPVGVFTYRYLNAKRYPVGITEIMIDDSHPVLFATAEKEALVDKIILGSPGLELTKDEDVAHYLYDDLRVDPEKVKELDIKKLKEIALTYSNSNIELLVNFLEGNANE